ncbi:MAG TPA: ABC transporter ATP-binding protein [Bacteroidales bacterium]|nr:ABC transporter ATP-binding protein [Bacteroidales bacterium]HPT00979.1 ABC transporter ATP-binding protein [Bacteroidales bacterium]
MTKLIQLTDVSAGYNDEVVLRDVNLEINDLDFIGVIGPNGGGKTTLIKVLLGLIKPLKGTVTRSDERSGGFIGYLPQASQVDKKFPITVLDIVLSGLMSARGRFYRYSKDDNIRAHQLLAQMGIGGLAHRTSRELSGGQLQRVFICRALISNPRLLILDEPNTFVDNRFESDLYQRLIELNKKMAIMIVTHDVGTISYYVKTIACVNVYLHYHRSNIITEQQLADYNCPLQIITHGDIPHTVLQKHEHDHQHSLPDHD